MSMNRHRRRNDDDADENDDDDENDDSRSSHVNDAESGIVSVQEEYQEEEDDEDEEDDESDSEEEEEDDHRPGSRGSGPSYTDSWSPSSSSSRQEEEEDTTTVSTKTPRSKSSKSKNKKMLHHQRRRTTQALESLTDIEQQHLQQQAAQAKQQQRSINTTSSSTRSISSHHNPSSQQHPRKPPFWLLPVLMFCVVAGTSLWFSGNVVLKGIAAESSAIQEDSLGFVVSAVNAGFIAGALSFAVTSASDRMPPTRLFMRCCIMGAISNLWMAFIGPYSIYIILTLRFFTGFCLAGIYPVGMKVASDWYENGLGTAMGYLVGCVVMGTALPFMLDRIPFKWRGLIGLTSGLATTGGAVMGLFVPDGPYRKPATKFDPKGVFRLLTHNADYRCACFGYLAHMWEVYVYWGFVVVVWRDYLNTHSDAPNWDENTVAFVAIGIGWLGCIIGGYASEVVGSAGVAAICLFSSGTLCLLSPLFYYLPADVHLVVHLFWGMVVVADTPQLSTLISQSVPGNKRGSALTLSTCLGYAVSIVSVQLVTASNIEERFILLPCGPGPLLGVWFLRRLLIDGITIKHKESAVLANPVLDDNATDKVSNDVVIEEDDMGMGMEEEEDDDQEQATSSSHDAYYGRRRDHYQDGELDRYRQVADDRVEIVRTTRPKTIGVFDDDVATSSECDGFENYLRGDGWP